MQRSNHAMERTAGSHGKEELRIVEQATRFPASRRSSYSR